MTLSSKTGNVLIFTISNSRIVEEFILWNDYIQKKLKNVHIFSSDIDIFRC